MAGLLEPSGGSVMLDGRDLTRLPAHETARRRRTLIGVVMHAKPPPAARRGDNVGLPLRLDGVPRAQVRARSRGAAAGGGPAGPAPQRRRAALGRRAHGCDRHGPRAAGRRVLLADEPTGELDEATAAELLDLIDRLRAQEETTILNVPHNPQGSSPRRRVTMRDGRSSDER